MTIMIRPHLCKWGVRLVGVTSFSMIEYLSGLYHGINNIGMRIVILFNTPLTKL